MRAGFLLLTLLPLVVSENAGGGDTAVKPTDDSTQSNSESGRNADLECEKSWRLPDNVIPTRYDVSS